MFSIIVSTRSCPRMVAGSECPASVAVPKICIVTLLQYHSSRYTLSYLNNTVTVKKTVFTSTNLPIVNEEIHLFCPSSL